MSLPRFWAFLAVALPVLASLLAAMPSTDLAYHLRAGAEILDTGRIPDVDTWTFTARGEPWIDQQWGAQVLLTLVFRLSGWAGLVILRAALVGLLFAALFELCRRRGLGLRLSAWLTLGAFLVTVPALALRPQLIGMALFAATLLIVFDRREHPRRLWLIPAITFAWANIHGTFFFAPAVLGLVWLADLGEPGRERHLPLWVAIASTLAACVTPFGPAVWAYAAGLGANPEVTRRITEWQPTSLRNFSGFAFFGSGLLVAAYLARRGRAVPWATLLWLGFFFLIGAYAARGVAWWPLGAVAAIATLVDRHPAAHDPPMTSPTIARANAALAIGLVLAGVLLLPLWRPTDADLGAPEGVLARAPAEVTGELRRLATAQDRLLNPQPWGSWFEFALPGLPVAIDSRIELFPGTVWDDYVLASSGGDGWEDVLDRWGVTIVVTEGEAQVTERLVAAGWREAFDSTEGKIFVREGRP